MPQFSRRIHHTTPMWTHLLVLLMVAGAVMGGEIGKLPSSVKSDPDQVFAVGISSGAFMAVQMHVAFSRSIRGAGVLGMCWC